VNEGCPARSVRANQDFTYLCSAAEEAASCSDCTRSRDCPHADRRDPVAPASKLVPRKARRQGH
jgi:hypothetical protein